MSLLDSTFAEIHHEADRAGMAAAEALVPRGMRVMTADPITGQPDGRQSWDVPEGVCGFAWVNVSGNSAFGRWAKKYLGWRKGYPSGLQYWISQFNQSMQRKEAYAHAYAQVLMKHGIKAYAGSRMD